MICCGKGGGGLTCIHICTTTYHIFFSRTLHVTIEQLSSKLYNNITAVNVVQQNWHCEACTLPFTRETSAGYHFQDKG